MTTPEDDPRTLKSWEDAFGYPIPTVRNIERRLRANVEEGRERLRGVVGSSYRDLLGTARTIVSIDGQMKDVERLIVQAGRKSDSRVVDRIVANYGRFEAARTDRDSEQFCHASRLFVLQGLLSSASQSLKASGSTLVVAKSLVLARLLHKAISIDTTSAALVERLGRRLTVLRNKLLRRIDKRLVRPSADIRALSEDLFAFSIATSSTPSDVLRHFQYFRKQAIARPATIGFKATSADVPRRLDLLLSTLKESRAIFPDMLGGMLKALASKPLLADNDIAQMEELQLDVHERWLGRDILNYTLWTRHDELQRFTVEQLSKSWTADAFQALTAAVSEELSQESDAEVIAETRKTVLQTWLSSRRDVQGMDPRLTLDEMRTIFAKASGSIISKSLKELQHSVCEHTFGILQEWHLSKHPSTGSLWDPELLTADLGDGAAAFKRSIVNRRSGKHPALDTIQDVFESNVKAITGIKGVIVDMRKVRWEDDANDDDDDIDANVNEISNKLSKEDPQLLESHLQSSAEATITHMERLFLEHITDTLADCSGPQSSGIFTIRLVRGMRQRLPSLLPRGTTSSGGHGFGDGLLQTLHSSLMATVSDKTHQRLANAFKTIVTSHQPVMALWDGTPLLPVQPSPGVYVYLYSIVKEMDRLGADLWAPTIVAELKMVLAKTIAEETKIAAQSLIELGESSTSEIISGPIEEEAETRPVVYDAGPERPEVEDGAEEPAEAPMEALAEVPAENSADCPRSIDEPTQHAIEPTQDADNSPSQPADESTADTDNGQAVQDSTEVENGTEAEPAEPGTNTDDALTPLEADVGSAPTHTAEPAEVSDSTSTHAASAARTATPAETSPAATPQPPAPSDTAPEPSPNEEPATQPTLSRPTSPPSSSSPSIPPPTTAPKHDPQATAKLIQLLFDVLYLDRALSTTTTTSSSITPATSTSDPSPATNDTDINPTTAPSPLQEAADALIAQYAALIEGRGGRVGAGEGGEESALAPDLDAARLRRSAEACWRRGYLLFGLLYG